MKIKSFFYLLSVLFLLCVPLLLISCEKEADNQDAITLYVYNWGEYISDGSEGTIDVNAAFEEYYLETFGQKVIVNYSTYSSTEDLYAKISSGAVKYDVIIPSDYTIQRMIEEDLLLPLNYDNIPNFKNIDSRFTGDNCYYDIGNVYSVPYFYGMIGIIYNGTMVDKNDPDLGSWDLMWSEKYTGNILQFNNPRDAFGTAAYKLGYSVNSATEEQWQEELELLKKQKSVVQGYVMDEIFNKMKSGSAAISAYYAGDFLTMYEGNSDLCFYYPQEGTNAYFDAMCVPKNAMHPEIAERYINFMLTEEIGVANALYTYYASPNTLVIDNEEYQEALAEVHPDAFNILYTSGESIPTEAYLNLSPDKLQLQNDLWEELKIESSMSISLQIICYVILLIIVAFFIIRFIIRKKHSHY